MELAVITTIATDVPPDWLMSASDSKSNQEAIPLRKILVNSLYYPSSGFDGDPVKYLGGSFFSFVYVDYGYDENQFVRVVNTRGFKGYHLLFAKAVDISELSAGESWRFSPKRSDGDPLSQIYRIKTPFCYWCVFERNIGIPTSHGPSRFSLLYLCSDGVAAFKALYTSNLIAPRAVAIIQPGHAFGGNWTDFTDPEQILARLVLEGNVKQPEFLLYGGKGKRGFYRTSCWPNFRSNVCFLDKAGGGTIGIWRK